MGARVIKVERPGAGDFIRYYDTRAKGQCSHFVWINRSKESLELDVKNAEDLATLKQLINKADVFLQNLAPGAADRLGLGYDTLSKTNDQLIVCDISGYGSDGPYKNKKAYDLLIQSESGVLNVTASNTSLRNPALSALLGNPWISVVQLPSPPETRPTTSDGSESETLDFLRDLPPHGLARSRRLRADLAHLFDVSVVDLDVQLTQFPSTKVRLYCGHIRKVVAEKPHVLVAYAWVMYMAIFSGGKRFIRAELSKPGPSLFTSQA